MIKEEVELLPSGLVTCLINEEEVRILKLSPEILTLRLADKISKPFTLKVAFYNFNKYTYEEILIDSFKIISNLEEEFYFTYIIKICDDRYLNSVRKIVKDYYNYIMLKNYGTENEFSKEMVEYPAEKDYDFYEFYSDQKKDWMLEFNDLDLDLDKELLDSVELALKIDNTILYNKYLEMNIDSFKEYYFRENFIEITNLKNKQISRIYVGNEFCHNLFPKIDMLLKILNKANKEKLNVTICFTYLRENYIEKTRTIIDKVYEYALENNMKIEVVINDFGLINLFKGKTDIFNFVLGVLLNKRKKDPRYIYKNGYKENKKTMAKNNLNSTRFNNFLKGYNINRYEYEVCGYKIDIAKGNHSLQLPFYQTNTSQYCPLYAMCKNQDRGKQTLVKCCPKYCTDYIFAYPKHLKMVGRYNSLFAFDDTLLKDKAKLEYYIANGIDRIVMNFM